MRNRRRITAGLLAGLLAAAGLGLLSNVGEAASDPVCAARHCAP